MEKRTIAEIIGIVGLMILGGVNLSDNDAYYCESRNIVMNCDRLSSTLKTCYNSGIGNKICTNGQWEHLQSVEQNTNEPLKFKACKTGYSCINGIQVRT